MTAYNATEFDPPAPVAYVTLRNGDTGTEWSDVPQAAVKQLNLTVVPDISYELAGFDGHTTLATMVQLEVIFCRRTFRGQFLLIDQPWGILGRNVLNNIPLLFDGPNLMWHEHRREG